MSILLQRHHFDFHACNHRLHALRLTSPQTATHPTLVFLHEGLGSIGQWRNFPEQLCASNSLPGLVYERQGYGHSESLTAPHAKDYLHREAQDYLPEVLTACGVTEPPILFGHSDGGSIALLYAAMYPDQVRAVIVEAAHVSVEAACLQGIGVACHAFQHGHLRAKLHRYHGNNTESMFRSWSDIWLQPDFRDWDIERELQSITCPVLVIQGANDEYGTRAQVDAIVANVTGTTEILWLPDCGHAPHHQLRETVLEATTRFIDKYSR